MVPPATAPEVARAQVAELELVAKALRQAVLLPVALAPEQVVLTPAEPVLWVTATDRASAPGRGTAVSVEEAAATGGVAPRSSASGKQVSRSLPGRAPRRPS